MTKVDPRDALFAGSESQLRLQLGELTAGEMRAVKAVIGLLVPNEREREILQCMVDSWVDNDMPLPGGFSYGEAMGVLRRFRLNADGIDRQLAELQALADRRGVSRPTTRAQCIGIIDAAGKRDEFVSLYGRSPEEYFAEYADREPTMGRLETDEGHNIWISVFSDLNIGGW